MFQFITMHIAEPWHANQHHPHLQQVAHHSQFPQLPNSPQLAKIECSNTLHTCEVVQRAVCSLKAMQLCCNDFLRWPVLEYFSEQFIVLLFRGTLLSSFFMAVAT